MRSPALIEAQARYDERRALLHIRLAPSTLARWRDWCARYDTAEAAMAALLELADKPNASGR